MRDAFENALRGEALDHQFRTVDDAGTVRWIRCTSKTEARPGETPRHLYSVSIDISEQKRVEETLRTANEDLNRFAYAAAHDLREPLRNIGAYSELLARQFSDPASPPNAEKVQRAKQTILDGVRRMDRLLADLLEYNRAGTVNDNALVTVDANAAVQRAVEHLGAAIVAAGARVTWDLLPRVPLREAELASVFQNLIGNAIKYRRLDPPCVHVSAEQRQSEWLFSVSDNGEGIDSRFARHIFGMFKRLHGPDIPGTGIGLAICEKIITKYGGRIWVESTPGDGSKFLFTVPMKPLPAFVRPQPGQ